MKQILLTKHGAPEVFKVREVPEPMPSSGELKVCVKAAGVNYADVMARLGLYPDAPPPPCVVGYEVSGIVEAVGPDVDPSWIGKEVIAATRFGGYSSKLCVPLSGVFSKPPCLSFEQAGGLFVNYVTAWQLLVALGGLKKGETLLIHNAGGGVGLAALDIAKHIGASTLGTASERKHDFLKERGLGQAIDYRSQDFTKEVRKLTQGRGVDLVIDPLGGSHWKQSYAVLAPAGRLGMFGMSTATESRVGFFGLLKFLGGTPWFHPISLMNKNRGVFGVNVGHLWEETRLVRGWVEEILRGVQDGWVNPHVDRPFRLEEAARAHRYLEERRNIGKVVLIP